MQDLKIVEDNIKKFEEKNKKTEDYMAQCLEEEKKRQLLKTKEWEEKHFIAVNKDLLISPEDFSTFVPKKRQKKQHG